MQGDSIPVKLRYMVVAITLSLFFSFFAPAEQLKFQEGDCEFTLIYDTKNISATQMQAALALREESRIGVRPSNCPTPSGGVVDAYCDQYFNEMKKIVADVKRLKIPKELELVRSYVLSDLAIQRELTNVKFRFAKTREIELLKFKIFGVDPKKSCASNLQKIADAKEQNARWDEVRYGWHNCMNYALRTGGNPTDAAWDKFLAAYKIKRSEACENP